MIITNRQSFTLTRIQIDKSYNNFSSFLLQIVYCKSTRESWTSSCRTRNFARYKTYMTYKMGHRMSRNNTLISALAIQRYFRTSYYNMRMNKYSLTHSSMTTCHQMRRRLLDKNEIQLHKNYSVMNFNQLLKRRCKIVRTFCDHRLQNFNKFSTS